MKKILDTRFKVNGNLFIIHHNDKSVVNTRENTN